MNDSWIAYDSRNCDDACLACTWALQQHCKEEHTPLHDICAIRNLVQWLYKHEFSLKDVVSENKQAAVFMLHCLKKYKPPIENAFLLVNANIALKTLQAMLPENKPVSCLFTVPTVLEEQLCEDCGDCDNVRKCKECGSYLCNTCQDKVANIRLKSTLRNIGSLISWLEGGGPNNLDSSDYYKIIDTLKSAYDEIEYCCGAC